MIDLRIGLSPFGVREGKPYADEIVPCRFRDPAKRPGAARMRRKWGAGRFVSQTIYLHLAVDKADQKERTAGKEGGPVKLSLAKSSECLHTFLVRAISRTRVMDELRIGGASLGWAAQAGRDVSFPFPRIKTCLQTPQGDHT